MMLWHPLLVPLQERLERHSRFNTSTSSRVPDFVVHTSGQNSVPCDWGEKGTGDAAAVTAEFTNGSVVSSFQMAQVIYVHKTKRRKKNTISFNLLGMCLFTWQHRVDNYLVKMNMLCHTCSLPLQSNAVAQDGRECCVEDLHPWCTQIHMMSCNQMFSLLFMM